MNKITILLIICLYNGQNKALEYYKVNGGEGSKVEMCLFWMYKDIAEIYESMNRKQARLENQIQQLDLELRIELRNAKDTINVQISRLEKKIDILLAKFDVRQPPPPYGK